MDLHELMLALIELHGKGYGEVEVTVITRCWEHLVSDEIEEVAYDGNANIIEIFGRSSNDDTEPGETAVNEDDDPVGEDPGLLVS